MSRWHTTEFDLLPERAFRPRGGQGKFSGGMTLEGGKGSAPAPDPRMGEAALKQIALNEQIYADYRAEDAPWMRDLSTRAINISEDNAALSREQLGLSRSQIDRSNALADYQLANMRRNDERYWGTAVPFENELLSDARRFDSAEYKQGLVDRSIGDVQQSFDKAQAQNIRGLSRMGVNPNSGMALAARSMGDFEKAKAMADAANKTRQAADQVGLSTKMQMYGGMKGLAGLGATNAGLATSAIGGALSGIGAGTSAIGMGQNAASGIMSAGGAYLGANNAAQGAMNTGISAGISGYGNYINSAQNAVKINNDADPFASILGAGAKLGAAAIGQWSDRRLKTDIVLVGQHEVTGLNLYEFRYINGNKRFRGVMADEVERSYPYAVFTMPDGYKAVNYAAIGMEMVEVEGETA